MNGLALALLFAQDWSGSAPAGRVINEAIAQGQIPGAVLLVGHNGRILHRQAYGQRALTPKAEAMTADTIFDAASLTKVVATTSAIMKLVERGDLRLNDPVTRYLPEFQGGKSAITVRHLLVHYSGMRPDVDLEPEWSGYETGIQKALIDKPTHEPGGRFVYSDINFLLLGEIVRRLNGKSLAEAAREQIFAPLGMKDTGFQPAAALRARIAPTEHGKNMTEPLRGVVHDPTARFMGGIAGHAGLFTTADDLAKFCEMMLNRGAYPGGRIFAPLTVDRFTSPASPPGMPAVRGLGWDIDSPFASQRGDLFPVGGYGHTGFTGTSIWIDPPSRTYIILLTNSVHPKPRPAVSPLRSRIASIAAAHLPADSARGPASQVLTGLDVLAEQKFAALGRKKIGLVTNHTGLTRDGQRNIDVMKAAGVALAALFSPEHGIAGKLDHEKIGNSTDAASGLPVYSLYDGPRRKPTPKMLAGIEALVFDIADVGARFYTYSCTLLGVMEIAAERGIPLYVLDRPNPITGVHTSGPMLDPELKSFIGCAPVPLRHGMTLGELGLMMNASLAKPAKVEVVKMTGWRRGAWFDETGLGWVNPSPNMRSLNAALLYPGLAMIEASRNYSVGRGTDAPFEQIGADWIQGRQLAAYLNERGIPGVRVYPTRFTPESSNFAGKSIEGVRFVITDRERLDPVALGLELCAALAKLYPGKIDFEVNAKLIGNRATVDALKQGRSADEILPLWRTTTARHKASMRRFLLY